MMDLLPLHIFPEGALASSVITTVLVGVWVTVFFNLRFGWVLSGLIVPGYLTPLIILEPLSAAVVALEAVLTYLIVQAMAVTYAARIGWTTFFGRDRFFALVLVSIGVRLLMDGIVLPEAGRWLNNYYNFGFDWQRDLESFGLIIIALYANQFWKPGLVAGLLTSAVTIGLTLLIVRYGLMEFTNFRISDIGYLYELIAASLLASPKAYMILIVTAFVASRLNLRAGLDFNGLLIPALMALQWYEPLKILTSLGEALLILVISSALLKTPLFANATIEGGRKLLLFFNVSFAWKMLIGYGVLLSGLDFKTGDAFGFGYLLSTLVALKLHDKGGAARMLTSLVFVSAQGALFGTLLGFVLSETGRALVPPPEVGPGILPTNREQEVDLLAMAVQRLGYLESEVRRLPPPDEEALEAFHTGIRQLNEALRADGAPLDSLVEARQLLALAGFTARTTPSGYVVVENPLSQTGRTLFIINPAAERNIIVSVPDAQAVRGMSAAAAALFRLTSARAMIVKGALDPDVGSGVNTHFHEAHRAIDAGVVQLTSGGHAETTLQITGRFPEGFDLSMLERLIGPVRLATNAEISDSPQSIEGRGFALLNFATDAIFDLIAANHDVDIRTKTAGDGMFGYLRQMAEREHTVAFPEPPSAADLLYAEVEIIAPLLNDILPGLRDGTPNKALERRLLALDAAAEAVGYGVRVVTDSHEGHTYVVLASEATGWGTYAFAVGDEPPAFIQVPTGLRDRRTLVFGLSLFRRLDAAAILVAGPAFRDGRRAPDLDVLNPDHEPTLYDLVSKMLIASRARESVSIVLRNAVEDEDGKVPDTDIVLSQDRLSGDTNMAELANTVVDRIRSLGMQVTLHDGTQRLAGFEPGALPQAGYLTARPDASFLTLWLTPRLRESFADRTGKTVEHALFTALDVPNREIALAELAGLCTDQRADTAIPDRFFDDLRLYLTTGSATALDSAIEAAARGYKVERIVDVETLQTFLVLIGLGNECPAAIINLNPISPDSQREVTSGELTERSVRDFSDSRVAVLRVRALRR